MLLVTAISVSVLQLPCAHTGTAYVIFLELPMIYFYASTWRRSEFIDATNFISRAWPRTMSVAERGWSDKETRDTDDAFARFHEWRCKVAAQAIFLFAASHTDDLC